MKKGSGNKKHSKIKLIILIIILVLLLAGIITVLTCFKIDSIQITGNVHYSQEEIKEIVMENDYIDNSLLLFIKNKINPIENVPFIEQIDIEYISPHSITITVYEKAMAGCIEYMGEYLYFDKDGIVLETANSKMDDVPCIRGLKINQMILHEPLPIDDDKKFKLILTMTQMIKKYELTIDGIRFTSEDDIVLYHNNIIISLGSENELESKMADLGNILLSVDGKTGTLHMEDFNSETKIATFIQE